MLNSEDRKVMQEALDDWHRSDYVDALLAIIDRLTTTTPGAPRQEEEDTARLDWWEAALLQRLCKSCHVEAGGFIFSRTDWRDDSKGWNVAIDMYTDWIASGVPFRTAIDAAMAHREAVARAPLVSQQPTGSDEDTARLKAAIAWAMGYADEFPARDLNTQGAYYWRTELARRSGMTHEELRDIGATLLAHQEAAARAQDAFAPREEEAEG